jgi:two-component system sensor histidine kinase DesK
VSEYDHSNWGRGPLHPGRVAALLGLLWLAYPIAQLFGDHSAGPLHKAWCLALAAVVIAIIATVLFKREEESDEAPTMAEVARIVTVLAVCDIALTLGDRQEWGSVVSVFVIAFACVPVPGRQGVINCVIAVAACFGLQLLAHENTNGAFAQGLTFAGLGVTMLAIGNIVRANRELRKARAEMARLAVAEERSRFARDLHDLLGHSLSLIAIKARLAERLVSDDPDRAVREIADIEHAARTSLTEVREAVTGYRRPTIAAELAGARSAIESAGLSFQANVTRMPLEPEDEAVIAWALREAATNVVRHSGARKVDVSIEPAGDGGARLVVVDDGRGGAVNGTGNGLRGLRERVAARQGVLETGPADPGGFRVAVTLPGSES